MIELAASHDETWLIPEYAELPGRESKVTTVAPPTKSGSPLRQNWIVNPTHDILWIIGAPLLAWVWAAFTFKAGGVETVWMIFIIFNVAHHFPTFIRIYGDRDLLRRYRWNLLLGPLIPFSLSMLVVYFVIANDLPIMTILFLQVILNIWDPWHFLMQHYGFMRIYDRHNKAPRKIASTMDYLLCWTWFAFIMVAASEWLFDILYKLYSEGGVGLVMWIDQSVYSILRQAVLVIAVLMTFVYIGYLAWCRRKGYFISPAKCALFLITFVMLGLCYVKNPVMQALLPGWTFMVGFATLGMVHVTQYLAIVWTYNRNLAQKPGKTPARFARIFATGGVAVAICYVVICLLYGVLLTDKIWVPLISGLSEHQVFIKIFFGTAVSLNFTSTLLHYYYDGFIWKVRHKENRQNLAMAGTAARQENLEPENPSETAHASWWDRTPDAAPAGKVLLKQLLYFGTPIIFIVVMTASVSRSSPSWPVHLAKLVISSDQTEQAESEKAIKALDRQIRVEEHMQKLSPKANHLTYLADLRFFRSQLVRTRANRNGQWDQEAIREYGSQLRLAIEAMERAIRDHAEPYRHREDMLLNRESAQQRIDNWQRELMKLPFAGFQLDSDRHTERTS
ncbi:MAG: hypothetical protein VB817_00120, partial [Pirellulaceae bacterium]